jgi:hypothetical protein
MSNKELEIPAAPIMMQCNRDYRLASLSGWVINFKANEPAQVHPFAYAEAVAIGAVPVDEEPELGGGPEIARLEIDESVAKAAEMEAEAKIDAIERAIVSLYKEGDMTAFRADNYPKVANVLAILPGNVPKPTAMEIQQVFDDMQEDVRFADLMGA